MNKILKIVLNTILILMIIITGLYFILRLSNTINIYKVETGSMEDKINVGDYLIILKQNNYNIGDVVTYKKDNYFITHRIIKMDNKEIITKGDANTSEDEPIKKSNIVGKVIYKGKLLNILIDYKYVIVSVFISLYLLSLYLEKK